MTEKLNLNQEIKQILLGSLLGDGSVYQSSKSTAWYSEVHSIKQKEYLLWKNAKYFERLSTKIYRYKVYEKTQKKYYDKIAVRSKALPILLVYRELFYPNGRKVVKRETLNQIDKLGLAVWYSDDGNYHILKKNVRLMTDAFFYEEQRIIQNWFKKRWSIPCKIAKRKRGSFYIKFDVKESEKFLKLIKKYIPKCMLYKLGHLWEGNREKIEAALKRESIHKKEYYINNRNKILKRQNKYRQNPKIKRRDKITKRRYYQKNRDKILERTKKYQKENKEKIKRQRKEYYSKNRLIIKEREKRYYLKNRDKILKRQKEYNQRPEIKERKKRYDKERYIRKKRLM